MLVVYVIDEPDRIGFAYGTTAEGPESGEESFILEHRDDDTVWLTIRSLLGTRGGMHRLSAPRQRTQAPRAHPRRTARAAPRGRRVAGGIRPAARRARARSTGCCPHRPPTARDDRAFGVYVHVPFCRVRCGYCDFNTYTADELRGARQADYADHAIGEIRMSRRVLEASGVPDPTGRRRSSSAAARPRCCRPPTSCAMLGAVRDEFGLAAGAEVTTEANPDSVGPDDLRRLADGGFTRVSFGMQSAVPHVLAALDRTHDPERIPLVVGWARDAGLDVSLDLIYGTPGESLADWRRSVERGRSRSGPTT